MSPNPMPLVGDANDESVRWEAWERSYMTSSHRAAMQARIAFALLLTATAVWLGLQIMSMPVG
jgi:hypothetical protein